MDEVPDQTLKRLGLRNTPQRRAILGAFAGGRAEHLSADEVHARAQRERPELSRATVYATLAEFAELGVLGSIGMPDPVRYEINAAPHDHFRCRVCLRHFDLEGPPREAAPPAGFTLELVKTRLDGVCADCAEYEGGLVAGTRAMGEPDPFGVLDRPGVAVAQVESPLGPLMLAAGPEGLLRVAFEGHGDFAALRERAGGGGEAARAHLSFAAEELERFFAGELKRFATPVALPLDAVLRAASRIPYGRRRSYSDLEVDAAPRDIGRRYGANPVPLFVSCHRVTCGPASPAAYVGGTERRRWLEAHERRHA